MLLDWCVHQPSAYRASMPVFCCRRTSPASMVQHQQKNHERAMGEQSQFHRRFFTSKPKRLKSPESGANRRSSELMSPEHRARSLVRELATCVPGSEFETKPKEVSASPRLSRQSAANGNSSHNSSEGVCADISGVQPTGSSLSTLRHIDDEQDDEQEGSDINNNDKQEQTGDIRASERADQTSAGGPSRPTRNNSTRARDDDDEDEDHGAQPSDHIETLSYHPDNPAAAAAQKSTGGESRRIRDSKLFKATKAILLFRRATSSLGHAHARCSTTPTPHHPAGFGTSTRSFVASFWRQNTADNSTCTRSSRMDSIASSNNNSSSFGALLNGGDGGDGGGTKNSSSQVSLGQQGAALSPAASTSSFSLPRFIVPKMNALRLPIVCHIKSLDGELMREVFIHRYELGQYIMDNLRVSLDMKDAKYFGLKVASSLDEQEDVRQPWLDLNESVYKQISKHARLVTIKNVEEVTAANHQVVEQAHHQQTSFTTTTATTKSVDFYLRIKYYPPNLARIQDPFLKQYLWLQLRRDLRLGKLTSSMNNLTHLMACVLQYELGDYKQELVSERLPQLNVLPNQDLIEQQAIEIWQTRLAGTKRHLVLMQFLRASVILETYGFDYYPVRDHQRQRAYLLGFNYAGVKTIRNGRIINHFRWHNLSKISHERRMIIFHIYPNENSKRKQILGFKCLSNEDCQNLYMRLLEQKYFFTVDLTYFDKSIRRPSHLTESAIGRIGDRQQQQQQQQLSERARQRTLDTDYSFGDEDDDDDDGERPGEEDDEEEVGVRAKRGRYAAPASGRQEMSARRDDHESPTRFHINPSNGARANASACAECKRAPRSTGCSSAPSITKSTSLQEPGGYADAAAVYNQFDHYFSRPSSPVSADIAPAAAAAGECYSDQEPPTPRASHFAGAPMSTLQRQVSVSKYTPEFSATPPGGGTDNGNTARPSLAMPPQRNGDTRGEPAFGVPLTGGRTATSQRLVDLTERVLTQPATLLATSSSRWPSLANNPTAAGQIPGQPDTPTNVSSDLFLQAMRFCLLIVLMNLMLRLSEGLSNVLIDLLTFGSSSSHAAGIQPAQHDSPSAHLFDRASES